MIKKKRFAFWICRHQECHKSPAPETPSTTICKIALDFVITAPLFVGKVINEYHLTLKLTAKIILFNTTI